MRLQMKDSKEIMKGTLPRGAYRGEHIVSRGELEQRTTGMQWRRTQPYFLPASTASSPVKKYIIKMKKPQSSPETLPKNEATYQNKDSITLSSVRNVKVKLLDYSILQICLYHN